MVSEFMFPHNVRAYRASVREQAEKQLEEAKEVIAAIDEGEPINRVLEEEYDLVQATEGFRRKFASSDRRRSIAEVIEKSSGRGDYGVDITTSGGAR